MMLNTNPKAAGMLAALILVVFSSCARSADSRIQAPESQIQELPSFAATTSEDIPEWARLQRLILDKATGAAMLFHDSITDEDGYLPHDKVGPFDDLYELYFNWPLIYALGGDEVLLTRTVKGYHRLNEQLSESSTDLLEYLRVTNDVDWYQIENPQMDQEFSRRNDWFHFGEGLQIFYDFGLADPGLIGMRERAVRFADWYISPPIYDPEHNLIVSYLTGSDGPSHTVKDFGLEYKLNPDTYPASLQPHFDQFGIDWQNDPELRAKVGKLYEEVVMQGDIPLNLLVTSLVTNAYLYTGDEKYRNWVTRYVDGWLDRIEQTGGIIPDNTDMQGIPGGNRNGQWWGGFFGWTHRDQAFSTIARHVAAQNAFMLSNDTRYHDLIRGQYDYMFNLRDGDRIPTKHSEQGWFHYSQIFISELAYLWHMSMAPEDYDRIEQYRAITTSDINETRRGSDRSRASHNEWPRIQYYSGLNPDWPEQILQTEYDHMMSQYDRVVDLWQGGLENIPHGLNLYHRNPIIAKGLTQVMLGSPQTVYWGGMNQGLVRYFDIDRMRPGVPRDVAVFVDDIVPSPDGPVGVGIHIVNLSETDTSSMIVQSGVYAQHEFVSAAIRDGYGSGSAKIDGRYIRVTLPPGTTLKLDTQMQRNVNQPTYAFPWHR